MNKISKQLYTSLTILIALMVLLLVREIKNYRSITTEQTPEPLIAVNTTPIPTPDKRLIFRNNGAPLTIVEYVDLGNKQARQLYLDFVSFVRQNPTKARLVFKNAPASHFFNDPTLAHKGAYCASRQDCRRTKTEAPEPCIWPFLDSLLGNNYSLKESGLRKAASDAGLKIDSWWTCVNDPATADAVAKDKQEAIDLQAGEPPIVFLNNRRLSTMHEIDISELLNSITSE